jgi:WD40 repeat protein/serine/threonine protein kinase
VDPEVATLKRDIVATLEAKNWAEALPHLEEWCKRFPGQARAWLNRGYCLVQLSRFDEAILALDRCLEIDPSTKTAHGWKRRAEQGLKKGASDGVVAQPSTGEQKTPTAEEPRIGSSVAVKEASSTAESSSDISSEGSSGGHGWPVGSVIDGRYEVRSVARGGMAEVAIAFDRELQRMVAVKTPLASVLAAHDGRARFHREAEAWMALGIHPNICCAYYLQEIGGLPRLFMEFVNGGDLGLWLKLGEGGTLAERLDIAIQIAGGLDYTHNFEWTDEEGIEQKGVVHRDIKPANILLTADGIARVTDFGLVRVEDLGDDDDSGEGLRVDQPMPDAGRRDDSLASGSWQTVTDARGLVGTPPYMAPELWRRKMRGTVATDIYAYGCMLYEIVCGRRPFEVAKESQPKTREAHLGQWMRLHVGAKPADPRALKPEIDSRLASVLRSCIAEDPASRPQSFGVLRRWLVETYEESVGKPYPRPEPQRIQLLADSLNNRGVSYVTLGVSERAHASFRAALEVDPAHVQATFNLGLFEWRSEGLTDAELERRLGESLKGDGDDGRGSLLQARLRLLLDNPQGAVESLRSLPAVDAQKLIARREMGLALLAQARAAGATQGIDESCAALAEVERENPSDLLAVVGLAEAWSRLGDEEAAAEAVARARALAPDHTGSIHDLARSFLPGHFVEHALTHQAPVQCLALLSDGRLLSRTSDHRALIWAPAAGRGLRSIDLGGSARQGRSFAVAGGSLVAVVEGGPLTLFDLESGSSFRGLRTHPGIAICVAVSPDWSIALSGGSDRLLRLWNMETGECTQTLEGHDAFVSAVVWPPNAHQVISASADETVRLWDLAQGRALRVMKGHRGPVRALAVDELGRFVISAGQDSSVGVWDLATGESHRFLRGHQGPVTSVAVAENLVVAGGEDGTLRFWDLSDGASLRVMRLPHPVQDVVMTADGNRVFAAHGATVTAIEVPEPLASRLPLALVELAASSELVGRDREFRDRLTIARGCIESGQMEDAISPLHEARKISGYELNSEALELWGRLLAYYPKGELRSAVEIRRFDCGLNGASACVFSPDGTMVIAGDVDGGLKLFETSSGSESHALVGHEQGITRIAVSNDGGKLVSAGRDGSVRLWKTEDGESLHVFEGHKGAVRDAVFAAGDQTVISAGDDGSVRLWPLAAGMLPELLGQHEGAALAVAASADGSFAVSAGWDRCVTVWNLEERSELQRFEGHEGAVNGLAISPDCRFVASAGEDGTIRVWDLQGERCLRVLSGHQGPVRSVDFAPDGRYLLSGGRDATLRVWDLRTGKVVRGIEGHAGPVADVAISNNGSAALSAGSDASLRLWFLDWELEVPERGRWDDRVRPFLEAFLRRKENLAAQDGEAAWTESEIERLVEDLGSRGYGWLATERVEKELQSIIRGRAESRTQERERSQELTSRSRRRRRMAPVAGVVQSLTHNIGLKLAVVAAAAILVMLGLMSLRAPEPKEAIFHRTLSEDVALLVREREMRLRRGAALAFQGRPTVGPGECVGENFRRYLAFVLDPDPQRNPPFDPGRRAEDSDFRTRYAEAVGCLGQFADPSAVEPILRRVGEESHPFHLEDLLSILVRVGGRAGPRLKGALTDSSERVRHIAALALVNSGDPGAAESLVHILDGNDPRGVEAGSYVLTELIVGGVIAEPAAFQTVRRHCRSIDPRVRRNAVKALILFESSGPAGELLLEALSDSDPGVAETAQWTKDTLRSATIQELFGY